MKLLLLGLFVLSCIVAQGHAELQCYVCENCNKVDDKTNVATCIAEKPTDPPVNPTDPTTLKPTDPTVKPTDPTTVKPTDPTVKPTDPTTVKPTDPTVKPTDPTTENPTDPTAVKPTDPTVKPTDPTVKPTDPTTENPTDPTAIKPTDPTVKPTDPTTIKPTDPTVKPTDPITEKPTGTATDPIDQGELNPGSPHLGRNDFPESIQSAVPQVFRVRRAARQDDDVCKCFKLEKKDGEKFVVVRGARFVKKDEDLCTTLKGVYADHKNCKACDKDKCNSSAAIKFSVFTLLALLLSTMIFK